MFQIISIFSVLCILFCAVNGNQPVAPATGADLSPCPIDSPDRDQCMKTALQNLFPKLYNGLAAAHIRPLDPLVLDDGIVRVNESRYGQRISADGTFKATLQGFSDIELKNVSSIVNDELFDMDLVGYLPYIQVEGYFKGRINLSGLNLNTKITFNATLQKATAEIKLVGAFEERDGERFLRIDHFDLRPTSVSDFKVDVKGIFPDERKNSFANEIANNNWRTTYKEIVKGTRPMWEPLALDGLHEIFNTDIPFRAYMYRDGEEIFHISEKN